MTPEPTHSDGLDESRVLSVIPEMIIGDKNVAMWLQMIGIRASQYAVARLRREKSVPTKVLAGDRRVTVYDREALAKLVRAATGVSASCWLVHNESPMECKVYVSDKAKGKKISLQTSANGSRSLYAVVVPLPGWERQQEGVLIDRDTGKPYLTLKSHVAAGWNLSHWPGSWRIVKYTSLLRAASPLDGPKGRDYKGRDRRAISLISAHFMDPETGRLAPVQVPATVIGWRSPALTSCIFAPPNIRRRKIALHVKQSLKGHRVFWWMWTCSVEVQPVTLDPVRGVQARTKKPREAIEIPTDYERPEDAATLIDDLVQEGGV